MPRAFDLRTPPNDHDPLANLLDFAGAIDSTAEAAGGLIKNFLDGMLNGVVEVIKELTGLDLSELAAALESIDLSSPQAFVTSLLELAFTLPAVMTDLVNNIINLLITLPDTMSTLITPLLEVLVSVPDDVLLIVNGITGVTGLDLSALGALDPVPYLQDLQTAFASLDLSSPTAFIESIISEINTALGIDLGAITAGSVQPIIDAILGSVGFAPGAGATADVEAYFGDLLGMLGGPALASGTFDPVTAVENFVTGMLHPTNLLAPLVGGTVPVLNIPALPIGGITGLGGYLTNLSSGGVLALAGLAPGTLPAGVTAAISNVTGLGGYLTNLANTGAYNAAAGFNNLASSLLKNLTPSGANMGQFAAGGVTGALANATIAGSALSSAIASGNVPSLPSGWPGTIHGSLLTGSVAAGLISGALSGATLAGSALTGSVAASIVSGALSGATIAGSALTSAIAAGNVPALGAGWGGTLDGSKLVGSIAAGLISGALTGVSIAGSAITGSIAGSIISGALSSATLAGSAITGSIAAAAIPPITATMAPTLAPIDTIVNALLAPGVSAGSGFNTTNLANALQTIPHPYVVGNLGSTTGLGGTVQNMLDGALQAINNNNNTGGSLALWSAAMNNMSNFLGYDPGGVTPPTSVAAIASNADAAVKARAVQNNIFESIDPTTNGVFSLADVETITPLPTVAVTAGTSAIGYINTRDGGIKQSVRWLGYGVTGITSFILNLYSVNPTTGVLTNVYSSANIIGSVGTGAVPVWNAYNLPALNYLNAAPGNLYAVELVVAGSGTYNLVGKTLSTQVPAHPTAIPAMKGAVRPTGIAFDNIGPGNSAATNSTGITFTYTANGPMLVYVFTSNTANTNTCSVTYGGVAMTRLGTALTVPGGSFYFAHVFKLDAPVLGVPQTVAVTNPSGWVKANAVSYAGATFGTPVTTTGSGTAMAHTVSSVAGGMVSQAFFNINATSFSTYNQTSRWYSNTGTWTTPVQIGDAPGATSVPFTETGSPTGGWASIAVPMTTTATVSPATVASPVYSNLTPWFGLAGSAGATQYTPVLITLTSSGPFNPLNFGWANNFDVVISGGGGAGGNGSGSFGGTGGAVGVWTTRTLTKAQAGSSNWTATIGAGGIGSSGGPTAGSPTSVVIPGQATMTAGGGTIGTTGGAPQPLANPGASQPAKVFNGNSYPGGAGGGAGQQPGGQPGAGGAGGNSILFQGNNIYGGNGGPGVVYIFAYQ